MQEVGEAAVPQRPDLVRGPAGERGEPLFEVVDVAGAAGPDGSFAAGEVRIREQPVVGNPADALVGHGGVDGEVAAEFDGLAGSVAFADGT